VKVDSSGDSLPNTMGCGTSRTVGGNSADIAGMSLQVQRLDGDGEVAASRETKEQNQTAAANPTPSWRSGGQQVLPSDHPRVDDHGAPCGFAAEIASSFGCDEGTVPGAEAFTQHDVNLLVAALDRALQSNQAAVVGNLDHEAVFRALVAITDERTSSLATTFARKLDAATLIVRKPSSDDVLSMVSVRSLPPLFSLKSFALACLACLLV
jgi:hypothetical protein